MKHVFTFEVVVEAEHGGRSPKQLAKEVRSLLPRLADGTANGHGSRKGYYAITVKKVGLRSTQRVYW